jgi:serine/threonine-protein kinase
VSDRLIREAAAVIDRLAIIDDRDDAVRSLQANIKEALAQNLRDADQFDAAIAAGKDAVAARQAAVNREASGKALGNLGFSQMILGIIARDADNRSLACATWRDALATLRKADATGQIVGFHKGFIPGIDAHVKACIAGTSLDFPMR